LQISKIRIIFTRRECFFIIQSPETIIDAAGVTSPPADRCYNQAYGYEDKIKTQFLQPIAKIVKLIFYFTFVLALFL